MQAKTKAIKKHNVPSSSEFPQRRESRKKEVKAKQASSQVEEQKIASVKNENSPDIELTFDPAKAVRSKSKSALKGSQAPKADQLSQTGELSTMPSSQNSQDISRGL